MSTIASIPSYVLHDQLADATVALIEARRRKASKQELKELQLQIQLIIKAIRLSQ
jgi:hypothetical protein